MPTVVSFLSYRPEIIQSTGFELQIREEEDDPGDGPALYGAGAKKSRRAVQAEGGRQGQVYGNWRGPSKTRPETDAAVQVTVHSHSFMWFKIDVDFCALT